jgi:hypothetical protein
MDWDLAGHNNRETSQIHHWVVEVRPLPADRNANLADFASIAT